MSLLSKWLSIAYIFSWGFQIHEGYFVNLRYPYPCDLSVAVVSF
jgi:hypothetical protein